MKKKSLFYVFVLGSIALMQIGCSTYSYTSRSTSINRLDIESKQQNAEIKIDYNKKITAVSDFQKLIFQAKEQAIYQCIMNNDVDIIIDPIFQIENRGVGKYRATVTGFAGYYKNGLSGIDEVTIKKYSRSDIENYLLLTDPNFYQHCYNTQTSGDSKVYNIKCGNSTSKNISETQSTNTISTKKITRKNKKMDYKKAKRIRDIGILLTSTGFFSPAGIPMIIVGKKKMEESQQTIF